MTAGPAAAAALGFPVASRSRASTSAGPAPVRRKSSTPQSAWSAARPASVTMPNKGTVSPVAWRTRHVARASARSALASISTASGLGPLSSARTSRPA